MVNECTPVTSEIELDRYKAFEVDDEISFSIVIPTYRRPTLLSRAVESAVLQQYHNYEIIIVDDGSGSNWDYSVFEHASSVRMVRNVDNAGVANARNCGIRLAKGRYVCFLDDDDEYDPNFLTEMAKAIRQTNGRADFLWCGVRFINYVSGRASGVGAVREFPGPYKEIEMLYGDALSIGSGFGLTVRRDLLFGIGMFDESLRVTEDTDLIVRLINAGGCPVAVQNSLVSVHNHDDYRLTGPGLDAIRIRECAVLLDRHHDFFQIYKAFRAQLERHMLFLKGSYRASEAQAAVMPLPVRSFRARQERVEKPVAGSSTT